MKYKVAISDNLFELEKVVNALLVLGWKLQGGVCCNSNQCFQALVMDN